MEEAYKIKIKTAPCFYVFEMKNPRGFVYRTSFL